MLEIKIEIDKSRLEKLSEKNIKEAIKRSIDDLLIVMQGTAVKVTPIRTWRLRKWFWEEKKWLGANFFNEVKYAPHVNFWTKRQKANPFMENILKDAENKIEKIFNKNFNDILW